MNAAPETRIPVAAHAATSAGAARPAVTPRPLRSTRRHNSIPAFTHAVFASGWIALAVIGTPYYRLEAADRLRHPWHALLKPAGTVGLAYGYLGTLFLLLLLLYLVRKRVRALAGLGKLRKWLDVHILCGLMGPAFITLHAGFRIHGLIAVGYWAMLAVMASGFVGYYLYSQLPRAISAQSNQSELLQAEIHGIDGELADRFGLGETDIQRLRRASGADRAAQMGVLASLFFLLSQDLGLAFGLRRLKHSGVRKYGRAETYRLRELVRQRVLVERRRAFLRQTETLFGYWHTVHKPFAMILYILMVVHIGIAVWLGYAWAW